MTTSSRPWQLWNHKGGHHGKADRQPADRRFPEQGPYGLKPTTLAWDTENPLFPGSDLHLDNNGTLERLATKGAPTGNHTYEKIELGKTYLFVLTPQNSLLRLATVTVFTRKESQFDIEKAGKAFTTAYHVTDPPPQAIESVRVDPGPDMADVSFTTRHPTIPFIEILDMNGAFVTGSFGPFEGAKKKHRATFGRITPLPQGTSLQLRITAPGQKEELGIASAVRTVKFRTGRRAVTVFFDEIDIQNDGDPGLKGAGEFRLTFMAGDARDEINSGKEEIDKDIDASDPPLKINISFPLPVGPREVFLLAGAQDQDPDLFEDLIDSGLGIVGTGDGRTPGWGQRMTSGFEYDYASGAIITDIVDVSEIGPGTTTIPFTMQTGNFAVAFGVTGRIEVTVSPGRGVRTLKQVLDELLASGALLKNEAMVAVGKKKTQGGGAKGLIAGLGTDGQLWTKSIDPERPTSRNQGWQLAAKAPEGPVTVIWTAKDRAEIVAVSGRGTALRLVDGEWRELGGSFQGALIGIPRQRGGVDLIGRTADGKIAHRLLSEAGGDRGKWRVSGEAISKGLCAVPLDAGGIALFAIGRDGRPVHALFENGAIGGWQPLGDIKAAWLAARRYDDGKGLIVAAITEKRQLHILSWRNYPETRRRGHWRDAGPYDEITPPLADPEPRDFKGDKPKVSRSKDKMSKRDKARAN